ncbi:unnamed protein product [Gongylonema pulchrum]|uniref:40S ribosomal protein S6 n=1 Tax=Gongylonema pulchrum TaxID=637853 RepID=A0A183DE54_9BILA|nr:unnamed protein product [Gongylonema pulchrum]
MFRSSKSCTVLTVTTIAPRQYDDCGEVKSRLKWADGAAIKRELDLRMMLLLGPKTIADIRGGTKQAEENGPKRSGRKNLEQETVIKGKIRTFLASGLAMKCK